MGMTVTMPHPNLITRLLIILAGITVLLWSGVEDNNVIGVTVLGTLLTILGVSVFIMSRFGGLELTQSSVLKLSPIVGGLIGAGSAISIVLLMLFKNVRHAHVFPDYPPQMMLDTLTRLPLWTISGGLIALGLALLWSLRPIESHDKGDTNRAD